MSEDLRFPIGKFEKPQTITAETRDKFIKTIEALPPNLKDAIEGLSDEQLDAPYRPEGWSVRQLVHHIADSHLNSFCRFKLGLSEDMPTIKPYDEAVWAEMADSKNAPVELSMSIIDGLHARWTRLLKSMTNDDFAKQINHPEHGAMTLGELLALYDWHSRHHTAHITKLRERNDW
ncbi:MAG: YfiT family bacillithiol transferase [Pyrinomonadaceae bacterium]